MDNNNLNIKGGKMEELFNYISNLGFPIVLSIFLLARIESKLEKLSKAIDELTSVIKNIN